MGLKENLLPERKLVEMDAVETAADTGVDDATEANVKNWMQSVRDRATPNADIRAAYNHSIALCMTIAALHTGERITFDDEAQEVVVG
jgi:hypothetical protein